MDKVEVQGNYYEVLGVEPGASAEAIRDTYRRLMQHDGNHPDLGGDVKTAALINKAYSVLRDPEQRRDYDLRLDVLMQVSRGFAKEPRRKSTAPSIQCLFCEQPSGSIVVDAPEVGCDHCGSPLSTATDIDGSASDQRAMWRVDKQLDLMFFTHWQQLRGFPARTEDMSPQGLRMVTSSDVRVGQRIRLISDVVDAVGDVTHCFPRQLGWRAETVAGIAFLTMRFARSAGGFVSRHV